MQKVCDVLEQLLNEGVVGKYAIGGATAAGFHGEPLATRDIDVFCFLNVPEGSFLVSLEPIFKKLSELGFSEFDEEGIGTIYWTVNRQQDLDVMLTESSPAGILSDRPYLLMQRYQALSYEGRLHE